MGTRGTQGYIGSQGCKGVNGDKGVTGAQGAMGARGPAGAYGNKGAQGDHGEKGLRGAQGFQGPEGPTGRRGCMGALGYVGPRGAQGNQGAPGPTGVAGNKGPQGYGTIMTFGTISNTSAPEYMTGYNNIYFDADSFSIEPLIDVSGLLIKSTNTGSGSGSGSSLSTDPYPLVFDPSINYTSGRIYISWWYPLQKSAGFLPAMTPYIDSLDVSYKISNDPSINVITDGVYFISPPSSSDQAYKTGAYVTGIIFTNIDTDAIGYQSNQDGFLINVDSSYNDTSFNDTTDTSKNAYVIYKTDINASVNGNTLYARYNNYGPKMDIFSNISFSGYKSAGVPSAPNIIYPIQDPLINSTDYMQKTSFITITTSPGTYTDLSYNHLPNIYSIRQYDFSYNSLGSDYRYTPLSPGQKNTSNTLIPPTTSPVLTDISNSYPDTLYTFEVTCYNNSLNTNPSDPSFITHRTLSLSAPTIPTSYVVSFTDTYNNTLSSYTGIPVESNITGINASCLVYNSPSSTSWISNDFSGIPIHSKNTRGYGDGSKSISGTGISTLLDISCTITRGESIVSWASIAYTGFPATQIPESRHSSDNNINISKISNPTDYYDNPLYNDGCKGFYLITGNNNITITDSGDANSIFTNSNEQTTLHLSADITGEITPITQIIQQPYSFYYDNIYTIDTLPPTIIDFDASLNGIDTEYFTQISGIWVLGTDISLNTQTKVTYIGNYFYNPTIILSYSTGDNETDLTHITSNSSFNSGKQLSDQVTFENPSITYTLGSLFSTSFDVSAIVYNCVNISSASSTPKTISVICDKPSYDLVTTLNKYPSNIQTIGVEQNTPLPGYRIITYASNNAAVPDYESSVLLVVDDNKTLIKYDMTWNINDLTQIPLHNEELQICNGAYRTYTSADGKGYLNYSNNYHIQNQYDLFTNVGITETDYRYATFAWKCAATSSNYNYIQFNVCDLKSDIVDVPNNVRMFYRVEDANNTEINANNINTPWINANSTSNRVNTGNYYNSVYCNNTGPYLGGKFTGYTGTNTNSNTFGNSITSSTYTINAIIPGLATQYSDAYIYLRIGFPMTTSVEFTHVTATLLLNY